MIDQTCVTVLDMPPLRKMIDELQNYKSYNALTTLTSAYDKVHKEFGPRLTSAQSDSLYSMTTARIIRNRPILPNEPEKHITVGLSEKKTLKKDNYERILTNRILKMDIHTQVGIKCKGTKYISIELDDTECDYMFDSINSLVKGLHQLICSRKYTKYNWVNINFTSIYTNQEMPTDVKEKLSILAKYYLSDREVPILYGGYPMTKFFKRLGIVELEVPTAKYALCMIKTLLTERDCAIEKDGVLIPVIENTLMDRLNNCVVKLVMASQTAARMEVGPLSMSEIYEGIL